VHDIAALVARVQNIESGESGLIYWSWLKAGTVVVEVGSLDKKPIRPAKLGVV
jgi:hypothetical protein